MRYAEVAKEEPLRLIKQNRDREGAALLIDKSLLIG